MLVLAAFIFLNNTNLLAPALLRLGRAATPALAATLAAPRQAAPQAFDGVENLGVEILHHVKHAQLVLRVGPEFGQQIGKFQGVIAAQTPIGSLMTTSRRSFQGDVMVSP